MSEMLTYSSQGLNVLSEFHEVDIVIWVEGQDDITHWSAFFESFDSDTSFQFKPAGGTEIEKYKSQIIDDDAQIIVATDKDYSQLDNSIDLHPRIVYTFGYSIENTMYCESAINKTIQKLSRNRKSYLTEIRSWFNTQSTELRDALIYDITNERLGLSVKVLGDNSCNFLTGNGSISCNMSSDKIEDLITRISSSFSDVDIQETREMLENSGLPDQWIIRGHFLTRMVLNLVKKIAKRERSINKLNFSDEALFINNVNACESCRKRESCNVFGDIMSQLETAIGSLAA